MMRNPQEILEQSRRIMRKLPKEGQPMVEHEHLFLEVWIDIRDYIALTGEAILSFLQDQQIKRDFPDQDD